MFKLLILLLCILYAHAGYECSSPTDCIVTCSNFKGKVPKPWIVVPWSNGSCYFHNTETREDRDSLPNLRH